MHHTQISYSRQVPIIPTTVVITLNLKGKHAKDWMDYPKFHETSKKKSSIQLSFGLNAELI